MALETDQKKLFVSTDVLGFFQSLPVYLWWVEEIRNKLGVSTKWKFVGPEVVGLVRPSFLFGDVLIKFATYFEDFIVHGKTDGADPNGWFNQRLLDMGGWLLVSGLDTDYARMSWLQKANFVLFHVGHLEKVEKEGKLDGLVSKVVLGVEVDIGAGSLDKTIEMVKRVSQEYGMDKVVFVLDVFHLYLANGGKDDGKIDYGVLEKAMLEAGKSLESTPGGVGVHVHIPAGPVDGFNWLEIARTKPGLMEEMRLLLNDGRVRGVSIEYQIGKLIGRFPWFGLLATNRTKLNLEFGAMLEAEWWG